MARIRTIKPEFTQSERIGRLSRDARLLFIQIWTIVDDEGRARASSRGLASALYPFDDDARELIDGWLSELVRENLITRYVVDGSTYLTVNNWLKHQKIDKPSASKLPSFDEASRVIDEASSLDLVPRTSIRTKDLGVEAREEVRASPKSEPTRSKANSTKGTRWPSEAVVPDEWLVEGEECRETNSLPPIDLRAEALKFANYWAAKSGGSATKIDWKRTWLNWCLQARGTSNVARFGAKSQLEQLAEIVAGERTGTVIDG